jgi:hypothetical protein
MYQSFEFRLQTVEIDPLLPVGRMFWMSAVHQTLVIAASCAVANGGLKSASQFSPTQTFVSLIASFVGSSLQRTQAGKNQVVIHGSSPIRTEHVPTFAHIAQAFAPVPLRRPAY